MFTHHRKSVGTNYTGAIAFLAAAVLGPIAWLAVSAINTTNLLVAAGYAVVAVALASITWKRASQLSIPSLTMQKAVAK